MLRILFLCTGNSCRSQMAEAWTRLLKGDTIEAFSAGVEKRTMDPRTVRVMREIGVDISAQRSKLVEELGDMQFDYVVTVCDNARESCPFFPAKTKLIHVGFDDPPALAETETDEEAKLAVYRRVRDEIRDFVETLPESLTDRGDAS